MCVAGCPSSDLQNVFVAYPGYMLLHYLLSGLPLVMSAPDCLAFCVASPVPCPSVDYMLPNSGCGASDRSRLDAPAANWEANSDFVYYQRACL